MEKWAKIIVDVEADGPCPGIYSMISFGAVVFDKNGKFDQTFYGKLRPMTDYYIEEALAVSGFTREQVETFPDPKVTMKEFEGWINVVSDGRPFFLSDNNGFDWQFINYYFHYYLECNPFGHSSTNIGSLYKGMERSMFGNFKHLRKPKHTHHPVDDAKGNAEALLAMKKMGLKI